jgi:UDP-2,4-diacetamido-2,4,6-trideoxy-beta-L-altropyranose hydrolase
MSKTLFIRADANLDIGTGHIMRCIALAQGWKAKGGRAVFITTCNNEAVIARLQNDGFQIVKLKKPYPNPEDWKVMSKRLKDESGAWVVMDGYHFDSSYHSRIKEEGHPLLVIDDMNHLPHYYADILLNQNIDAGNMSYSCEPNCLLLLGTRYALMRREFLAWKEWKREIPRVARNVMVTLGGSDPDNVTLEIIHSLSKLKILGLQFKVIAGPSHPQISSLRQAASKAPFPVEIFHNAKKMPDFMAWADLAISSGGTTCWELAYMKVPFATVVIAKNQEKIAAGLDDAKAAINLGWYSSLTSDALIDCLSDLIKNRDKRIKLICNGKNLVDGLGVERVQKQMVIKS